MIALSVREMSRPRWSYHPPTAPQTRRIFCDFLFPIKLSAHFPLCTYVKGHRQSQKSRNSRKQMSIHDGRIAPCDAQEWRVFRKFSIALFLSDHSSLWANTKGHRQCQKSRNSPKNRLHDSLNIAIAGSRSHFALPLPTDHAPKPQSLRYIARRGCPPCEDRMVRITSVNGADTSRRPRQNDHG